MMSVKPARCHPMLVALHWFLAAFIVLALALGMLVLKAIPNASPQKLEALRAHMIGAGVILTLLLAGAPVALVALHATAALVHHFVLRDGLLKRMWFGRRWPAQQRISGERQPARSHATS